MILLIDNYDSFSYNLVQYLGTIGRRRGEERCRLRVIRNDELTVDEIGALAPDALVLSPGPGRPDAAGVCEEVLRQLSPRIPTLGVCLGHQAICEVYGATITYARQLMHGKQSVVGLAADSMLFAGLPEKTPVARYHSLAAEAVTMPGCLRVTARTEDGEIMAVEHRGHPVCGVQFHPESVLTPDGMRMLENFVDWALKYRGKETENPKA